MKVAVLNFGVPDGYWQKLSKRRMIVLSELQVVLHKINAAGGRTQKGVYCFADGMLAAATIAGRPCFIF